MTTEERIALVIGQLHFRIAALEADLEKKNAELKQQNEKKSDG